MPSGRAWPEAVPTVLHYTTGAYLHFTETYIYGQIKHQRRWNPVVYCQWIENADIYPTPTVRVLGLPGERLRGLGLPIKAWNRFCGNRMSALGYIRRDKPSVAHAHHGFSGYKFLPVARRARLPMVVSFYGSDATKLVRQYPEWRARYRTMFVACERVLVEGPHMRSRLIELGCPADKAVVQHLGIDLDDIPFSPRTLGPDRAVKVLISASFKEKKGIPLAVEAFARVRKNNPSLGMSLTLIGDALPLSDETAEKARILAALDAHGLMPHVRMLGYQPYPVFREELGKHHIFLSPSFTASNGDTEGGSPVSITEAAASGMPVVSTTHCDIPEVVKHGETGLLAKEKNVDDLTEKMDTLVRSPERWVGMGLAARRHIEEQYDARKQAKALEALYDEVACSP